MNSPNLIDIIIIQHRHSIKIWWFQILYYILIIKLCPQKKDFGGKKKVYREFFYFITLYSVYFIYDSSSLL